MAEMLGGEKQSNVDCPIPVTWFTLADGTNCTLVQELYAIGDEFACHTLTHTQMGLGFSKTKMVEEIVGSRDFIANNCKIPVADVTGFRSPYLVSTPVTRQVLFENGFEYDSTSTFDFGYDNPDDVEARNRTWPMTMDFGVPETSCSPTDTFQEFNPNEKYPGLFEIPVWELKYDDQSYGMDPGADSPGNGAKRSVYDVMKYNFDASYAGNRAPLPLAVHVLWFTPERIAHGRQFIEYAASQPDVYFVTMQQLIEWMRNPVPTDQMVGWIEQRCGGGGGGASPGPAVTPTPAPVSPSPSSTDGSTISWLSDSTTKNAFMGRRLLAN